MKKVILSVFAVMILAVSLLVGCGGGAPNTLEGTTWTIEEASQNGMDVIEMAGQMGLSGESTCVFQDGEVTLTLVGQKITSDYTYENGQLTIEGETAPVNGDTVEFNVDGVRLVLKKK